MSQQPIDVAIVGASVAGSTLAYLLGQQGFSVALIDKDNFPRSKPCGEGLSAAGLAALTDIGLDLRKAHVPFAELTGHKIFFKDRTLAIQSELIGVRRMELDNFLLGSALQLNTVHSFLGSEVIDISSEDPASLSLSDGRVLLASQIVLASGSSGPLLKQLGIKQPKATHNRIGLSMTWRILNKCELDKVLIFLDADCEIFITPLGGGLVNAALLAARERGSAAFNRSVARSKCEMALSALRFEVELVTPPAGRSFLQGIRNPARHGALCLIGDACEQLDPVGGMGMTHAILSAQLLCQALLKIRSAELPREVALREYVSKREMMARPLRGFTNATYLALVRAGGYLHQTAPILELAGPWLSAGLDPKRSLPTSLSRAALSLIGAYS